MFFRNVWVVALLTLTGCFINARENKLKYKWPDHKLIGANAEQIAAVMEGYILKKDGDTLKGYIKMVINYYRGQTIKDVPLLPFDKQGETNIVRVDLDDIDYVRLKSARDSSTADFMPIKGAMWRMLGRIGQVSVCYIDWNENYSNSAVPEEGLLIIGKKLIQFPIAVNKYFHEFINKRYNENFDKNHFKGRTDMVNYILDRENATPGVPSPQQTASPK